MLYFHPRLQGEEDAGDLTRALDREVWSQWRLVVTSRGTLPVAKSETARLGDLAEIDTETGAFRILSQPADLIGMPRKNTGGRPSEHAEMLAKIIAKRVFSGAVLDGFNAECKAILADLKQIQPGGTPPSLSTVKSHLRKSRDGQ